MKFLKILLIVLAIIILIFILFRKQIAEMLKDKGGQKPPTKTKSPETPVFTVKKYEKPTIFNSNVNNPFNIKASSVNDWKGKVTKEGEVFESFDSIVNGVRAGIILIRTYFRKHGLNTIEGIIYRYAPPEENDTESYIKLAEDQTGFKRNSVLQPDAETIYALSKAMCLMENSFNLEKSLFDEAYILS